MVIKGLRQALCEDSSFNSHTSYICRLSSIRKRV